MIPTGKISPADAPPSPSTESPHHQTTTTRDGGIDGGGINHPTIDCPAVDCPAMGNWGHAVILLDREGNVVAVDREVVAIWPSNMTIN